MSKNAKMRLALVAFFLLAYIAPLGFRPMFIPDEFRYGEIPREMIASGDWFAPTLLDIPYYEKPAFGYQLNAVCFKIFGYNHFALRLPAALGAALGAFMLWLLGRRLDPEDETPAAAMALSYLAMGLIYGVGVFAVLDSQVTGFITLSIASFYLGVTASGRKARTGWLILAGAGAGLAFLVKGLLGIAVPAMVIGLWLLWRADWAGILAQPRLRRFIFSWLPPVCGVAAVAFGAFGKGGIVVTGVMLAPVVFIALFHRSRLRMLADLLIPLAACLILIVPMIALQHRSQPDFWRYFIIVEHIQRFVSGTEDSYGEPFWFYLPVLLGGIFPAALWLPAAVSGWAGRWRRVFSDPFWQLTFLWCLAPFLFFSMASAKLGTYVLPCFAPAALWLGYGVSRWRGNPVQDWVLRLLGLVLIAGGIGFPVYQILAGAGLWPGLFEPSEKGWIPLTAAALVWGAMLLGSRRNRWSLRFAVFYIGLALAAAAGHLAIPHGQIESKMPEQALEYFRDNGWVEDDTRIVVTRTTMHSVAWCWERSDLYLWGSYGELKLNHFPGQFDDRHFSLGWLGAEDMPKAIPRGKGLLVVRGDEDDYDEIPHKEIDPIAVEYRDGIWVAKF